MIRTAGLGVAVRNAADEIKKEANYITKNTNDESAVAEVINRYIFGEGKTETGKYKFRFPFQIFLILFIIKQLIAYAFNFNSLKLIQYKYVMGVGDVYSIGLVAILTPLVLCFVVDYFNQRTKGEDEEEFWISKYGKK